MAFPGFIRACVLWDDDEPKGTQYIRVVKRSPFAPPPIPSPRLSLSEALGLVNKGHQEAAADLRHGMMYYCEDVRALKPTMKQVPLPEVQPVCPDQWDVEAWKCRVVIGNSKFHVFFPGDFHTSPFIFKVADGFRDGGWMYEDIGSMTPRLRKELKEFKVVFSDAMRRALNDGEEGTAVGDWRTRKCADMAKWVVEQFSGAGEPGERTLDVQTGNSWGSWILLTFDTVFNG